MDAFPASMDHKDHPVTTAKAKAAPAAEKRSANLAHPSLRVLERPANLTGTNAPGFGSDVVADTLRALEIPYVALNPGASYRGLHDSIVNFSAMRRRRCCFACTRRARSRSPTATPR